MAIYPHEKQPLDGFGIVSVKAGGTILINSMVVLGTDGVAAAAVDCTTGIFGIAMEAGVDGDMIDVATMGVFTMDLASGSAPDVGDYVFVKTYNTIWVGDAADYSIGIVVGATPTSGGTADVLIHCKEAMTSTVYV